MSVRAVGHKHAKEVLGCWIYKAHLAIRSWLVTFFYSFVVFFEAFKCLVNLSQLISLTNSQSLNCSEYLDHPTVYFQLASFI